jgi:hypothetical protein
VAEYWVVGVDRTVQRAYPIDHASWRQVSPGYWEFRAIANRECTAAEIDAAYAAGKLPLRRGDACPTRGRTARTFPPVLSMSPLLRS